MSNNKFYVYLHVKETNGEPFYVGKGCDNRCYSKKSRSNLWNNISNKYGYDVIILEDNLIENDAFELEKYWIKRIGRRDLMNGTLVNFTDGGEGTSGLEPWNKGKICSQLGGENNFFFNNRSFGRPGEKHHMYGLTHSEYSKNKTSKTLKEIYKNKEHHRKGMTSWNKGKKLNNLSGSNSPVAKSIEVDGIIYISISEYKRINNIPNSTYYRRVKSGKIKIKIIDNE